MEPKSECPGESCLIHWLHWARNGQNVTVQAVPGPSGIQGGLFTGTSYDDTASSIRDATEFRSGVETLAYTLFRLDKNRLTRAERPRLENLVENAVFKMSRYLDRGGEVISEADRREFLDLQSRFQESRRAADDRRALALGIRTQMERLESLDGNAFEDFIAEVFEALDFEVDRNGGAGDEGADLKLSRGPMRAIVQCKYHAKGVVGSPDLQKFLGTIHQSGSHKGYFVTTTSFTLSAEKFAANQPMELIDGPRLAEIVRGLLAKFKSAADSDQARLPFGPNDDSRQHAESR